MIMSRLNHLRLPVRLAAQLSFGFAFWLLFLLVLQSGIVARSGASSFGEETARIVSASALGACSALLLIPLSSRFPLHSPRVPFHFAIAAMASAAIACGLVLIAWAGAPLVLSPDNPRLSAPLLVQAAADVPLLSFAIFGFLLLLNLPLPNPEGRQRAAGPEPETFVVRSHRGLVRIEPADIDWIEAQENYVALHCGGETHLVRSTFGAVAQRLGPPLFARIHRGIIVNAARIQALRTLPGGDGIAILHDKTELRVSRTYRANLRQRFKAEKL